MNERDTSSVTQNTNSDQMGIMKELTEPGLILIITGLFALLTVFMLFKLIYRYNPNCNERYGSEIILFHSDERYKKRIWRFNVI